MSDIVVDTNVWVLADRITSLSEETPKDEADCITSCYNWLRDFVTSDDRLVVDLTYRIMKEYRDNIPAGGLAEQELNKLESQLISRLVFKQIDFDKNGYAVLHEPFELEDESDRKFLAVAVECEPYAPILNATETDWAQEKQQLVENGITIHELCPAYIEAKMSLA